MDEEARLSLKFELLEEFGPFPEELNQLFFLLELRNCCKKLLIQDFKTTKQSLSLTFHEKTSVSPEKILKILKKRKGQMLTDLSCKIPLDSDNFIKDLEQLIQELVSDTVST